jgi:predicted amidophosphoribosyltransferase
VGFLSDVAHLLPTCPRCGYGLRLVRGYWWCDVCRVPLAPQKGPSVREAFRLAAESLRSFFAPASPRRATLPYPRSIATLERGQTLARCPSCRALTPRDYSYCVHCGTTFGQTVEVPRPTATVASQPSQRDDTVYRYIVENKGEISLSKASTDLRLTIPELQASIRRLEDSRRIMRDGTRYGDRGVA